MRKILIFLFSIIIISNLMAQPTEDFNKLWKSVESLLSKGLTTSALSEINKIYELSVRVKNEPEQVKAVMYKMSLGNQFVEGNDDPKIFFLDSLITNTNAPVKNIYQSMRAELLWSYLNVNRRAVYNKTPLENEANNEEISTWSAEKITKEIEKSYKESLLNEEITKAIPISNFDTILTKGNSRNLRPTLFDFIAHRALEYFKSFERYVTLPAYTFLINDDQYFSPASKFALLNLNTKDTSSLKLNALIVYQKIIKFHLKDEKPDALINADLERLSFVYDAAVFNNKDSIYENALIQIEKFYPNNPAIAQAIFLRANLHYAKGTSPNSTLKDELIISKRILEEAIARFPNSEGGVNSKNLLNELLMPSLTMQVEKVNTQGPFRSLITYKNISTVYFRIIKTSNVELKKLDRIIEDDINKYLNLKYIKTWSQELPNSNDFMIHRAEVKIDALSPGTYLILSSIDKDFNTQKNIITKVVTYVSNISYIENGNNDFYIVDRNEGFPLKGAKLNLLESTYNYKTRVYENNLKGTFTSDANGHIRVKPSKNNRSNNIQIIYKGEELLVNDDNTYIYDYNTYKRKKVISSFLFTDRAIYRPGQIVYFKGIVLSTDSTGLKSEVVAGKTANIILYDANRQKKGSLKLITNSFGSYSGSFTLPDDGLTGNYSISDSAIGTQKYFSVEEYKRPKFQTTLETPKGTYKLNDSITVKGNAKAYSGNNIDGANVSYRVVRKVNYPIWFYNSPFRKMFPPFNSNEMEIANGKTQTNESGDFEISFKAIPDETVDKKNQPTFNYEVTADVTDINGETRSYTTIVSVSYQAYSIVLEGDEKILPDLSSIKIKTLNTNKIFEKATVNVVVDKLQVPNKVYRERLWEMPDQFTISKQEYELNFPYDEYSNENQMSEWKIVKNIINKSDTTSETGIWSWPKQNLEQGWYKLTITSNDKYGEEVKAEKYLNILGETALPNDEIKLITNKFTYAPGEKLVYTTQSGFDKVYIITSEKRMNDKSTKFYNYLTNLNPLKTNLEIKEADRGGISINTAFVKHNRVYSDNLEIKVPWTNKDLIISFETWRDKLLPGENETWKINIKGNKKDKVAAEALINMYDASLDQFKPQSWELLKSVWPTISSYYRWEMQGSSAANSRDIFSYNNDYISQKEILFDRLLDNGWKPNYYAYDNISYSLESRAAGVVLKSEVGGMKNKDLIIQDTITTQTPLKTNSTNVKIRKDFRETAFFLPDLLTDEQGNISFSFKAPEALTQWKLMIQAHTKDLKSDYAEKLITTQKPLMVQPNLPRFFREGDKMEIPVKVVNITDKEISGTVQLELLDAITNKPVDGWFINVFPTQYFTAEAGKSSIVNFPVTIPINFNSALVYRIKAVSKDGSFSDCEEAIIPVLTNRKLVTETLPLNVKGAGSKTFKFEKLLNSGNSQTLKNYNLTVEYTSNPAWYVVQALPYLKAISYPSSDQYFTGYYANALASYIANSTPQLKKVFDKWQKSDTAALLSNLEKNEELKSALLAETPWVLEAKSETEQKKSIAMLFNVSKLSKDQNKFLSKLKASQTPNGGFSWFNGGPDNRYITTYILTGIGKLKYIGAIDKNFKDLKSIVDKAIPYLDARIKEEYDDLIKSKSDLTKNNLSYSAIQYLYVRSFFEDYKLNASSITAVNYYRSQAKQFWLNQNNYMQAMISVILFRENDKASANAILKSLLENSIYNEETGIHWKQQNAFYIFWYQAPIETQSMMIEAFSEITKDDVTIDNLKTWLLKNKQTNNWGTSKATADACYALILKGSNWIADEKEITIKLGNTVIKTSEEKTQAGTGYFKKAIDGAIIQPAMGNIEIDVKPNNANSTTSTSWGAIYWQYFEDLDKISKATNSLNVTKELFVEVSTDKGPSLKAIKNGDNIKVGQKVVVRIVLKTDRDLEFVQLKDMRSAGLEPVDVLSGYVYRSGTAYYQSTLDASTNYFFNWLNKGTYVFEYSTFASQSGDFSNGITTVQCLYAPEFSSHSEGIRMNIEK
ncbi:MAG: alpha-2-macroglobulin family protein [Ferruginibacter sp.]